MVVHAISACKTMRLLRQVYNHHYLPTGIGLDAPVQIIRDLNASGEFFAVFNDLTRCLGVGDITVVPANTPWSVPLSMELKAKQVDDVGSQAEIDFLYPHSDEPEFAALFQSVRVCLGLKDRGQPTTDSRAQRQIDELLERTDLLFRMRGRLATRLPPPGSNHWGSIRQLLNNSYTNGSAFDFPEAGVAYFSVRLHDNEGAAPQLQRVLDRVKVHQPPETVAMAVSTADLAESRSSVHPRPPNTPLAHSRRSAECPSCGPIVPGGDHHRGRVE